MSELLDIVNEQDEVIGQDTREHAHQQGLLHREIWLWLYNTAKGIVLQRRSKSKDRHPGLLAAPVAGHVSAGQGYYETMHREAREEAGLELDPSKIIELGKIRTSTFDEITQTKNDTFKQVYAYPFDGRVDDIPLEPNETDGFEWWPYERLMHPAPDEVKRMAPYLVSDTTRNVLRSLWEKIS